MEKYHATQLIVKAFQEKKIRFRVEQLFKFFWTVVSGLALVSLILVWFV